MRDFQKPGRSLAISANAMAATSHPIATATAIELLKAGGNAVDAAIGAALLLGTAEPQMTGIGGDCFALIRRPDQKDVIALNGSGRSPAGFSTEAIRKAGHGTMPVADAAAVTLPGAMDAFCRMSADHGRLGLDRVLQPAIDYAESGIPVAPRVATDWALDAERLSGHARRFYLNNGHPYRTGQIFRHRGVAQVLRKVAETGRDGFYQGEVAEDMVATLNRAGGTHSLDDFASVTTDYTTPISGHIGQHDLIEHPPNGQGAAAILLAKILSHFDIGSLDPNGAERVHLEAEATKLAYDARDRFIADPDLVTRLDHLISDETAGQLAGLIQPDKVIASAREVSENIHKETVYLTVVDEDRMMVSLIFSIFHGFGSGIASERFGILFHNRGAGFTLERGHPNEAGPGKRPMHTIIPAMLARDGRITMTFGVMGGAYQATGHAHVLSNILDFGMDIQSAMDAPRSFAEGGVLKLETGFDGKVAEDLARIGHKVEWSQGPIGGSQAIAIDEENGILIGASDPRKDGIALGY